MVGAAIGAGVSLYTASQASDSAGRASKDYSKTAANELGFAMEQYDDWKAVFGDLEHTLSSYYNNLTPELITAQGLEQYNMQKDASLNTIRETLAQRGISNSGLAAGVETQVELQSAAERAKIRAEAPMKVAEQQSKFLQLGLQHNPASNVQDALAGQSQVAAGIAQQTAAAAGKAAQAATGAAVDFITNADIFKSQK